MLRSAIALAGLVACRSPGPERRELPDRADTASPVPEGTDCEGRRRFSGDATLRTAADLSDFGQRYDEIDGRLIISGAADVSDLSDLKCLRSVSKRLAIADNPSLQQVLLPRLESTVELVVERNTALERVSLPLLFEADWVVVRENPALVELSLQSLEEATPQGLVLEDLGQDTLEIDLNAMRSSTTLVVERLALVDLEPFSAIEHIDRVEIGELSRLRSLAGLNAEVEALALYRLPALDSLESLSLRSARRVTISELPITSLSGLDRLEHSPELWVQVESCDALSSLAGLSLPQVVELELKYLPALESLDTLAIEDFDSLILRDLPALVDLGPLPAWREIPSLTLAGTGLVELSDLRWETAQNLGVGGTSLRRVDLAGLVTVHEDLSIGGEVLETVSAPDLQTAETVSVSGPVIQNIDLPALREAERVLFHNLTGASLNLPALEVASNILALEDSQDLGEVMFPALRQASTVRAWDSPGLRALGLPLLEEMPGASQGLSLRGVPDLVVLDISSLTRIEGGLQIRSTGFSTLGLSGIEEVGQDLIIKENALLEDISSLHNLRRVGKVLRIEDNPALSTADAEALAEAIEEIGDGVIISGNGP